MENNWKLTVSGFEEVALIHNGEYSPSLEAAIHIEERWQEFCKKKIKAGKKVFNGLALKLDGYYMTDGGFYLVAFVEEGTYRDYYGTCLDRGFREKSSQEGWPSDWLPAQADWPIDWFVAFCLGALPETIDEQFVLGLRGVGEVQSPEKFDMCMGHPWEFLPTVRMIEDKVGFELGIESSSVRECHFLALVEEYGGFNLVGSVQLSLDSHEVEKANPPGAHTERYFLEIDAESIEKFLRQVQRGDIQASPPVVPALILRGGELFGGDWQKKMFKMMTEV